MPRCQPEPAVLRDQAGGYRCQLHINAGDANAFSHGAVDFTRDFAPIIEAAAEFPARYAL
jgi:ATP-dependent DNA ligase